MQYPKSILLLFIVFSAIFTQVVSGELRIFWVDVEGGAATLVVTPAGESILIDTGNPGDLEKAGDKDFIDVD